MHALRQDILPPSGVEFAASLKLTPSTLDHPLPSNSTARHEFTARILCNVVVARSNILRIFEVREELVPISALPDPDDERDRHSGMRRGTEPFEGEVEMDHGDGFVNVGIVKTTSKNDGVQQPATITRFHFLREHRLHGIVTGLEGVRIPSSIEDNLDRLLISFKDAKIALLEWSDSVHDLVTISIHTYERAPQLMFSDSSSFRASLRVDPLSRCAALSLPMDAIAILPFCQTQAELEMTEQDQDQSRDLPYFPSFILDLTVDVDESIKNVIDFVFLPGFNNPTMAVLFQMQQTWTGRLKEFKDTVKLLIFTLDLARNNYPIITTVNGLPYDCTSLLPCSTVLGGVVVLSSNAIIYVDQSSRRVPLPVNGWQSRVSDLPMPVLSAEEQQRDLELEGCRSAFIDDKTFVIVLRDGMVYPVEVMVDGKAVSKLTIGSALAKATIPSVLKKVNNDLLFLGSTVASSLLLRSSRVEEEIIIDVGTKTSPIVKVDDSMDLDDDDDDIYGPSTRPVQPSGSTITKNSRSVVRLSLCDNLQAYGAINDISFSLAKNGDRPVSELVAATGTGWFGGFTLFQRDLPTRTKRKLHIIGGARGVWSISVRQHVKVNGTLHEKPVNPYQTENDGLIVSTDANPSPGLSRIAMRTTNRDISITTRIPGTTIGAAAFFSRTAILHVLTNAIRVLEPDGTERQIIKDMDGTVPRAKIKACSICDPYVLILREDDTIGLFIDAQRGKVRRKDMSPMGDKTSRYIAGCFFNDISDIFQPQLLNYTTNDVQSVATTSQAAVTTGGHSQWLILVRPQGVMEIWTLPKLSLAFSTTALATLQNIITDSNEGPALSLPQDPPRRPQDSDIEQIIMTPLGESSPRPHLFVLLRSGQMAIYEALASVGPVSPTRGCSLAVKFVKVASQAFDIHKPDESEKSVIAEQRRISHMFIPFVTSPSPNTMFSGVFFTGDRPSWILATDKGGVQIYPSGHTVVHSFTACSLWESKGDFLLYTDEGPSLLEWMPDIQLGAPLPYRSISRGRSYSNVVFEPSTSLIVAASSLQAKFACFDEDGNRLWEPDAPNISDPMSDCSTLELISPETWITMDGYEFATNEFVNAVECVLLETSSTETEIKEYIAVGTTVDRGEDLAAKGATYIFEIAEVVPDPALPSKRWYRFRLLCRDDAKGPVTAICGFNGYLVSSMGQKIFVRAFDSDERLVGVAFLDVGVYVTSLRSLKNLLLIGDAVKSVWFVAFQEDPYKLVILAQDIRRVCVTRADFFFTDGEMSIITGDEEGVIRMYEYDPTDPESKNGQHLLLCSEFHGQIEYCSSTLIARRPKDDPAIAQSKLICGSIDGCLFSLTPVEEPVAKRLLLLQGQLTRNIQHVAGLNPRTLRIVRNEFVSKPLSKWILDGNLLREFEGLPTVRQDEITRQIGTEKGVIMREWISLGSVW